MIVPTLPPTLGGLGDYAVGLWRALRGGAALAGQDRRPEDWVFLCTGDVEASRVTLGRGARVEPLPTRHGALAPLLERLGATTVAVQYVGYGYHPRGAPRGMARALAGWRMVHASRRLVIMFHELWAGGPPWTRAFWEEGAQRRAAITLARAADVAMVSTLSGARHLRHRCGVEALVAPIPSNVPTSAARPPSTSVWPATCGTQALGTPEPGLHEPGSPQPLRVVIFGLGGTRMNTLRVFAPVLRELARAGRLECLALVGAGLGEGEPDCAEARFLRVFAPKVPLWIAGERSAADVSTLLAGADLCLSPTPAHLVTKSGASMAALAHGVALAVPAGWEPCPLSPGVQLLVLQPERQGVVTLLDSLVRPTLLRLGAQGRGWYEAQADWPVQVARWREALGGYRPSQPGS